MQKNAQYELLPKSCAQYPRAPPYHPSTSPSSMTAEVEELWWKPEWRGGEPCAADSNRVKYPYKKGTRSCVGHVMSPCWLLWVCQKGYSIYYTCII